MDYKQLTIQAYDRYSKEFENNTSLLFEDLKIRDLEHFITRLSGKRILDLGSGPGVHSLYFKQRGFEVVCLDLSSEMVKLCKEKGLDAIVADLEDLPFEENSFDGVLACTSLLHIPKLRFPHVLKGIKKILNSDGLFYISMKQGKGEGEVESDKYPGVRRFFALYSDEELRTILSQDFDIFYFSSNSVGNAVFLNYICSKK